jgi:hypothetical protein
MVVEYDRWNWHTEGDFPKDQMPEQGYVHIGMYLAWLIRQDMLDPDWVARSGVRRAVGAVSEGSETVTALRDMTDGALTSDMLSAEGMAFTSAYYAPEYGYSRDWRRVFGRRADRYDVPDEWETYKRIAPLIDRRHAEWVAAGKPELLPMPSLLPGWLAFWRTKPRRPR